MHADQYEDALRYITGSGYGSADVFRNGTHANDWSGVRDGLRRMLQNLAQDISALPTCNDVSFQQEVNVGGFSRAIDALDSADTSVTETEVAYRVACALAFILKATLNKTQDS